MDGFVCSTIQPGILSENVINHLPDDTRRVIIHAVNPYGMVHLLF
ncbi:DUF2817 domain-containing protein [Vibrio salinus]